MPLATNLLEKNTGRPLNAFDFDRSPGLAYLVRRESSPCGSVWTPTWRLNLLFLVLTSLLTIPIVALCWYRDLALAKVQILPYWLQVAIGFSCLLGAFLTLLFASEAITRSRLVVDTRKHEVRITSGVWFWQRYTLPFAEMRSLKSKQVEQPGFDLDGESPVSNRVVYAELRGGELVLLARDPDVRSGSLYRDILDAIQASENSEVPRISV